MGLGLAEPGFATACFVEWEDYPRQTLIAAQRAGYLHPAPIWDNVKTFDGRPWRGLIDTVLAGYPCQPFSQAGQRKGVDDPRHLWPDVAQIITEVQPEWVFLENVAGHITLGLEAVLRELWGMGWTAAVGAFSAAETGAPHERLRVFIVAHRQGTVGRGEQPARLAGRGRAGFAGSGSAMADPDGGHPSAERQQRGGEQRFLAQGRGTGAETLDDAADRSRGKINSRGGPNQPFGAGGIPLPAQAAQWPTPAAHEPRLGVQNRSEGSKGSQISLSTIADRFSHPAHPTAPHGPTLSQLRPIWRPLRALLIASHGRAVWLRLWRGRDKRRLNPLFVEWLMGWPPGHALCACSATEFTLWQQRMRGALSALPTASGPWIWKPQAQTPAPVQTDLFGWGA